MMKRTATLGFRATGAKLHWDTDALYGRHRHPTRRAWSHPGGQQSHLWWHRLRTGEQMVPFHNQYGNPRLYRGGEMWRIIDARGQEVEALAEQMINVLMGRHRPDWKRGQFMGDHIIIVNARHVAMDDNEGTPLPWRMKPYAYKTGYHKSWGVQVRRADEEFAVDPCRPLWLAIRERMPRVSPILRHKPGKAMVRRYFTEKVHIFADDEHPYKEKDPVPLVFPMETAGTEQYHDTPLVSNIPRRLKPQGWRN